MSAQAHGTFEETLGKDCHRFEGDSVQQPCGRRSIQERAPSSAVSGRALPNERAERPRDWREMQRANVGSLQGGRRMAKRCLGRLRDKVQR